MYFLYFLLAVGLATDFTTSDYLSQIDQYVGERPFCETFPNLEKHEYERETCSGFGCDKWNYFVQSRCGSGAATLEYTKSNGQVYQRLEFKQQSWSNENGNLIRMFKRNAESYGTRFEITDVAVTDDFLIAQYQIYRGSQLMSQGAWHLKATNIFGQMFFRSETVKYPFDEVRIDRYKF